MNALSSIENQLWREITNRTALSPLELIRKFIRWLCLLCVVNESCDIGCKESMHLLKFFLALRSGQFWGAHDILYSIFRLKVPHEHWIALLLKYLLKSIFREEQFSSRSVNNLSYNFITFKDTKGTSIQPFSLIKNRKRPQRSAYPVRVSVQ